MRKTVRLKEITEIQAGQRAPQGDGNYSSCGIPFIKAGNLCELIDGKPISEIQKVSETIAQKYKLKLFPKGTVVFAKSGMSCMKGYVYMLESDCYVVNHLACIIPKDVNGKYLKYYLEYFRPNRFVKDTSYPSISLSDIGEMQIFLDGSCQQQEIVSNLDKINRLIRLRKSQLAEFDTLIKARFVEMFGDPVTNPYGYKKKALNETCKVITGNTPSRDVTEYYGDYMEWIKTDNIVSGLTNPTSAAECLSEKGMRVGHYVDEGAILMACIAGSIASIGRVCITDRRVAFNQQINAIIPAEYNVHFLYVLLTLSKEYLVEEINMALKGILSKSKLEGKSFYVPPMEKQDAFAAFVSEIDKSKFYEEACAVLARYTDNNQQEWMICQTLRS